MRQLIALYHRHGETTLNAGNAFRSRLDPPLNAVGHAQARKSADVISSYDVARVVTSPMLRAAQTAEYVARETGAPIVYERALMPWNLGFMSGKNRDEYAELMEYYVAHPDSVPPEGEPLNELKYRTKDYFQKALEELEEAGEVACFVAHTSNIIALTNLLEGNDVSKPELGDTVSPGGVIAIYASERGWEFEPLFGQEKKPVYGAS